MAQNTTQADGSPQRTETATLGGGCFWCLEPLYRDLVGVLDVVVGYSGGGVENPSYRLVCTGTTGHAEVAQVVFDPQVISYREILQVFFTVHNPTTLNRQGNDVGPQYRSVIFYHDQRQEETAEQVIREIDTQGLWDDPIVTLVEPFDAFYRAEEYHQQYYKKNPYQGYCQVVIAPKVAKFRKQYFEQLKDRASS